MNNRIQRERERELRRQTTLRSIKTGCASDRPRVPTVGFPSLFDPGLPPPLRQDGGCHRQLSEFCRRDLVPQVAAVARFRNAHSARPYISHRLHTQQESGSNRSSSRRKRAPSRLAQWPVAAAPAAAAAATATAARADGTVEVCAAGGNARLTLSASRMVAEVDYAIAVPSPGDPADTGSGGVLGREQAEAANPRSTTEHPCSGREWVTRQFLVGPGSSAVPPEFSHPVAVALRASSPSAAGAVGRISDGNGVGTHASNRAGGGGRKGFVTSELPRPENRPDHPRRAFFLLACRFGCSACMPQSDCSAREGEKRNGLRRVRLRGRNRSRLSRPTARSERE